MSSSARTSWRVLYRKRRLNGNVSRDYLGEFLNSHFSGIIRVSNLIQRKRSGSRGIILAEDIHLAGLHKRGIDKQHMRNKKGTKRVS